jgi:hypothetical protein
MRTPAVSAIDSTQATPRVARGRSSPAAPRRRAPVSGDGSSRPRVTLLVASGLAALLSGCLGSPEPYHPWRETPRGREGIRQPRPDPQKRANEDAALRLDTELPIEIARNEADREQARKVLGRIMSSIPKNPWVSYERDLVRTLACDSCGALKCDPVAHAEPWLPKGPPERRALALGLGVGGKPASRAEEDEDEEE